MAVLSVPRDTMLTLPSLSLSLSFSLSFSLAPLSYQVRTLCRVHSVDALMPLLMMLAHHSMQSRHEELALGVYHVVIRTLLWGVVVDAAVVAS